MAPQAAKKNNNKGAPRERRSRSRNTTPVSTNTDISVTPTATGESAYLHTSLSSLLVPPNISIEALIEKSSSNTAQPPSAASLNALHDGILQQVLSHVKARGEVCDRSMRELARKRKERIEAEREREEQERLEEERRKREVKKVVPKKREREDDEDETRPPTVGAHGLARQDGVDVHNEPPPPSSPSAQVAASAAARDASPSSDSDAGHQPHPAPTVAHYESFGEDPTKYDDPTIYHIRDLTPDMTEEERKEILCVATYPHDDLHDLTPGTPPDMDFSNAKPANQINFSTFLTYIEPYVRPLTEEDVAFLKERGDRAEPYIIPPRGSLPYKEVWAKEDGLNVHDYSNRQPINEPRGSIEDMNDSVAESEDVSTGPVMARLLSLWQHDTSANPSNNNTTEANGDISMVNGETTAGAGEGDESSQNPPNPAGSDDAAKPAFVELTANPTYKPSTTAPRDYTSLESRALAELRYMGLLTPDETPSYDGFYDDPVAARLRYLQSELRRVSLENGARKARVLELTEERMAMQEYNTIADDLDTQINTAYLKRNRTMSKPKKGAAKARPGVAVQATARSVVGEGVRMLMERRKEWRELIGPVVDFGHKGIPGETVFEKQAMERYVKTEGEVGDAEGE